MTTCSKHSKELTIAVCGPVDAGKSSLVGVLTSGELDNGRGLARNKILQHTHEIESGRTSSITLNPVKYVTKEDKVEIYSVKTKKKNEIRKISDINVESKYLDSNNETVVSYIDLAGHEKYLKTTVFGVTGMFPDKGIVVIGANTGITKLTREHLGILLYLKIPITIVITKIDLAPHNVYALLCNKIKKLLSKNTFGKIIYFISDSDQKNKETNTYIDDMIDNPEIIPVISISNKNGININNLHKIIYKTNIHNKWKKPLENGSIVYLDSDFNVPGIGLVVSGSIKGKEISVKQKMYIGPKDGNFYPVIIRSIHNSIRENVDTIGPNVQGCFAIKFVNPKDTILRKDILKGFVLVDSMNYWNKNIVSTFTARVTILHHSTTIKDGYSPVLHCGPIRQAAKMKLKNNDSSHLKSKDSAIVQFTFEHHKEFIEEKMIFFFRDGNTKGVGEVISLN
jgi:elongation factor 1-alpha